MAPQSFDSAVPTAPQSFDSKCRRIIEHQLDCAVTPKSFDSAVSAAHQSFDWAVPTTSQNFYSTAFTAPQCFDYAVHWRHRVLLRRGGVNNIMFFFYSGVPATLQRYNCTTEFLLGSVKGFTEF
jgi:hypothetical protein